MSNKESVMTALKNPQLVRTVFFLGVLFLVLIGCLAYVSIVNAQSQTLSDTHFIEIINSPDALGNPVIQCLDVTSRNTDGLMGQDCFAKLGEVCGNEITGPTEVGRYFEYWISLDRRGNCEATIRVGAPDLLCRVLIPNGMLSSPLVKCTLR